MVSGRIDNENAMPTPGVFVYMHGSAFVRTFHLCLCVCEYVNYHRMIETFFGG